MKDIVLMTMQKGFKVLKIVVLAGFSLQVSSCSGFRLDFSDNLSLSLEKKKRSFYETFS